MIERELPPAPPRQHLVFAYGSNMNVRQAFERMPRAELVGPALLKNYRLVFAGFSKRWDGAVASIEHAAGRKVPGLVYRVNDEDLARLDLYEGAPHVYARLEINVHTPKRRARKMFVYQLRMGSYDAPSAEYLGVIWRAYREWGFDAVGLAEAVAMGCDGKEKFKSAREIALRVMRAATSAAS